jgi:hypothetical protein
MIFLRIYVYSINLTSIRIFVLREYAKDIPFAGKSFCKKPN